MSLSLSIQELCSERLKLRPLEPRDATQRYLDWFDDGDTRKFIVAARQQQSIDSLLTFIDTNRNSDRSLLLGIFDRSNHLHIGNIKFEPVDVLTGRTVLGILIGDTGWRNRGAFPEAFEISSRWLFGNFGISQFWLALDGVNLAALRSYSRAGFVELPPPEDLFGRSVPGVRYMCRALSNP